MKKLMLMLGVATALTASAINPPKQLNDSYPGIIPSEFTTDSQGVLTTETDDAIVAYNSNLDVIATVSLPKTTVIEYTYWTQQRALAPHTVTLISTEETGETISGETWDEDRQTFISYYPQTLEDALRYLGNSAKVDTINGETVIAVDWITANFGQKYILIFYRFENGAWRKYRNNYEEYGFGPYGEWEETVSKVTYSRSSGDISKTVFIQNGVQIDYFALSQTLFNSDSQFEYVFAKREKINFSIDNESMRSGGEKVVVTGYSIMSQNGDKLYDIAIPTEYQQDNADTDVYIYILSDKKYFVVKTSGDYYSGIDGYCLFYELDSKSGVKAPKIVKSAMSVSPAAPRHGEIVTVDLGSEATAATMVNIVSTNGSTVRSLPVSAGQRNISLSTAGLASGLYVVSANGHEAAKIIIR